MPGVLHEPHNIEKYFLMVAHSFLVSCDVEENIWKATCFRVQPSWTRSVLVSCVSGFACWSERCWFHQERDSTPGWCSASLSVPTDGMTDPADRWSIQPNQVCFVATCVRSKNLIYHYSMVNTETVFCNFLTQTLSMSTASGLRPNACVVCMSRCLMLLLDMTSHKLSRRVHKGNETLMIWQQIQRGSCGGSKRSSECKAPWCVCACQRKQGRRTRVHQALPPW